MKISNLFAKSVTWMVFASFFSMTAFTAPKYTLEQQKQGYGIMNQVVAHFNKNYSKSPKKLLNELTKDRSIEDQKFLNERFSQINTNNVIQFTLENERTINIKHEDLLIQVRAMDLSKGEFTINDKIFIYNPSEPIQSTWERLNVFLEQKPSSAIHFLDWLTPGTLAYATGEGPLATEPLVTQPTTTGSKTVSKVESYVNSGRSIFFALLIGWAVKKAFDIFEKMQKIDNSQTAAEKNKIKFEEKIGPEATLVAQALEKCKNQRAKLSTNSITSLKAPASNMRLDSPAAIPDEEEGQNKNYSGQKNSIENNVGEPLLAHYKNSLRLVVEALDDARKKVSSYRNSQTELSKEKEALWKEVEECYTESITEFDNKLKGNGLKLTGITYKGPIPDYSTVRIEHIKAAKKAR